MIDWKQYNLQVKAVVVGMVCATLIKIDLASPPNCSCVKERAIFILYNETQNPFHSHRFQQQTAVSSYPVVNSINNHLCEHRSSIERNNNHEPLNFEKTR